MEALAHLHEVLGARVRLRVLVVSVHGACLLGVRGEVVRLGQEAHRRASAARCSSTRAALARRARDTRLRPTRSRAGSRRHRQTSEPGRSDGCADGLAASARLRGDAPQSRCRRRPSRRRHRRSHRRRPRSPVGRRRRGASSCSAAAIARAAARRSVSARIGIGLGRGAPAARAGFRCAAAPPRGGAAAQQEPSAGGRARRARARASGARPPRSLCSVVAGPPVQPGMPPWTAEPPLARPLAGPRRAAAAGERAAREPGRTSEA